MSVLPPGGADYSGGGGRGFKGGGWASTQLGDMTLGALCSLLMACALILRLFVLHVIIISIVMIIRL